VLAVIEKTEWLGLIVLFGFLMLGVTQLILENYNAIKDWLISFLGKKKIEKKIDNI
jgi:hypothetical protein